MVGVQGGVGNYSQGLTVFSHEHRLVVNKQRSRGQWSHTQCSTRTEALNETLTGSERPQHLVFHSSGYMMSRKTL